MVSGMLSFDKKPNRLLTKKYHSMDDIKYKLFDSDSIQDIFFSQ